MILAGNKSVCATVEPSETKQVESSEPKSLEELIENEDDKGLMKYLKSYTGDVSHFEKSIKYRTIWHVATEKKNKDLLTQYFNMVGTWGWDIFDRNKKNKMKILHYLAMYNLAEPLEKYIYQKGVSINMVTEEGKTAFILAAENGSLKCIVTLLTYQRDRKRGDGFTRVNIGQKDNQGLSAIDHAENNKHTKIVKAIEAYLNERKKLKNPKKTVIQKITKDCTTPVRGSKPFMDEENKTQQPNGSNPIVVSPTVNDNSGSVSGNEISDNLIEENRTPPNESNSIVVSPTVTGNSGSDSNLIEENKTLQSNGSNPVVVSPTVNDNSGSDSNFIEENSTIACDPVSILILIGSLVFISVLYQLFLEWMEQKNNKHLHGLLY